MPIYYPLNRLLTVLLICPIFLSACKKNDQPLAISTSGSLLVGSSITFHINAASGSKLLWHFSDGDTSTQASPVHIFYTFKNWASVTINDSEKTTNQSLQLSSGSQKLAGNWHWTHGLESPQWFTAQSYVQIPDTTFSIDVSNDTLTVWGKKLYYIWGYGPNIPIPGTNNFVSQTPFSYGCCFKTNDKEDNFPYDYMQVNYNNSGDTLYFSTFIWTDIYRIPGNQITYRYP